MAKYFENEHGHLCYMPIHLDRIIRQCECSIMTAVYLQRFVIAAYRLTANA